MPQQNVLGGLDDSAAYKVPCHCATTGDMTNSMIGLPVIDGYQTVLNDRVLVWQNTDQTTNGIYVVNSGSWVRAIDFANQSAIYNGTQIYIANGAKYKGYVFSCLVDAPTVGATPITFAYNLVLDANAAYYAELAEQAASLAATIAATNWGVWPSRSLFAAMSIAAGISSVFLLGYANPNDGGWAIYTKLSSPPNVALAGNVQTADGAWWAMAPTRLYAPETFGAFTSSTDCTAAVNNALTWINAQGGGELKFGGGSYTFLGTVTWPTSGLVSLSGCGMNNTRLVFGAASVDCLVIAGASLNNELVGVTLRDFRLDASARTGGRALYANFAFWAPKIRNVEFLSVYNGLEFYQTNDVSVDEVLIQGVRGSWGIYWHGSSTAQDTPVLNLTNVVVNALAYQADGMWIDGSAATGNFYNVTFLACATGMHIKNTAESANFCPQFIVAFNVVMDGMAARALQIDGGREMHFTNCWLQNTSTPGSPSPPNGQGGADAEAVLIGADVGFSDTSDIRFTACRIGNSGQRGVNTNARNIRFTDCLIEPGSKASPGTYEAILIGTGAQDIDIADCQFSTWGDPLNWKCGAVVAPGTVRITFKDSSTYGVQSQNAIWENTDSASYCDNLVGITGQRLAKSGWSVPASLTASNGMNLTAAQVLGGVLQLGGSPGGSFTATVPSAASLVAALENPFYLATVDLLVINSTAQAATLVTSGNVVFSGNIAGDTAHIQIAANSQRYLKIVFNNTSIGTEAVTIYT